MFTRFTEEGLKNISEKDPEWLRKHRLSSFNLFQELPLEKSQLFKKYVSVEGINWEELELKEEKRQIPKQFEFLLEDSTTFIATNNEMKNMEMLGRGVIFTDIKSAIRKHEDLVREYFLEDVYNPENKIVAFNNSFFNSGYFLYIPDNTILDTPLRVINFVDSSLICKNIIVVGRNSTLKFVEEFYSTRREKQALLNSVATIHLKEGAQANIGNVQNCGENIISLMNKKAVLEKDAKLVSSSGFFGGFVTLSRFDSLMKGDGSSSEDYEIVFGNNSQKYDITSNIIHRGLHTSGKVVVKGVFLDSSSGIFKGMIDINENAKHANAYLAEHSMLLSKDAKSDAIPGLEISNNEVKATHSASVAQINDDELFYLMSRGLSDEEAKKLIVLGFFDPLFRQIPFKQVKTALKSLFEIKWSRENIEKMQEIMEKISQQEEGEEIKHDDIFERHYKYR